MKSALTTQPEKKIKKKLVAKEQGFESDVSSSSDENSSESMDENQHFDDMREIFTFKKGPGKVSKDAKETMQECTSEFLLFITSEAQELC